MRLFLFIHAEPKGMSHRSFHNRPLPSVPGSNSGIVPNQPGPGSSRAANRRNLPALPARVSAEPSDDESSLCSSSVTSGSVRTQYGIPETEPGVTTEGQTVEETQLKERHTFGGEDPVNNVQPVYMYRAPLELRNLEPRERTPTQQVGGYPNLPGLTVTPIQAQSSLNSQSDPDFQETSSDPTGHEDIDDENDNNNENDDAALVPTRLPTLEEVIEVRDIHVDGEEEGEDNAHEKNTENIETLILADHVLKELKRDLSSKTCHVHIQNDFDFRNASKTAKALPQFPKLKSVVLHCGFRNSKKNIDKSLKDHIEETINNLDELYPDANLYISAVLPCRGNKNRVKIDMVNSAIEEVCGETSAEFVDYTTTVIRKEGKPDSDLYNDTVSLNGKGARRIGEMLIRTLGIETKNEDLLAKLGIETRIGKDCEEKKVQKKVLSEDNIERAEDKSWFSNQSSNMFDFTFSGL